jgi:thymidylate synthase (FAD)
MKVELLTKTIGTGSYSQLSADEIIGAVARHAVIKKEAGRLVRYLISHAHWSPMEHIHYTFLIETSRAIATQILRHKSGHFQQHSLRYSSGIGIEPIEFRLEHETNRQSSTEPVGTINPDYTVTGIEAANWEQHNAIQSTRRALQDLQNAYNDLIEAGIAKETARAILPLASTTRLHFTANLRDFLAFLNVRCDEHAQKEIRDIATAIGEELERHHKYLKEIDWRNGMFMWVKI